MKSAIGAQPSFAMTQRSPDGIHRRSCAIWLTAMARAEVASSVSTSLPFDASLTLDKPATLAPTFGRLAQQRVRSQDRHAVPPFEQYPVLSRQVETR
jgi:hypothetical protein